ncbi:hypothetical protein ACA910_019646 [Epithemia clementina (nom. ined.)]
MPIDDTSSTTVLTDWVVENLETSDSLVTRASQIQAGENDTLPVSGLSIGNFLILPAAANVTNTDEAELPSCSSSSTSLRKEIRLLLGRNGWGTGVHPSTRLCLEWISETLTGGEVVLDYGCGSGILSIADFHQGARICRGVDIEAEALITATRNVHLNHFGLCRGSSNRDTDDDSSTSTTTYWNAYHTREVLPYGFTDPPADIVLANILIGQLVRPSMVAALTSNVRDGGWLCFSGIRPGSEVDSLMYVYRAHNVEFVDSGYAELAAVDCSGSLESYGFDCGTWARVVGRKLPQQDRQQDILDMSELAIQ